MRCADVHALESRYIDGELDEARASALRGHLRMCEACRDRLADLALLVRCASRLEPVDPPPGLWRAIESGLAEAEIADARRSWLWLRWHALRPHLLTMSVAMAAVAVVALWAVRKGQEIGPRPARTAAQTAAPERPAPEPQVLPAAARPDEQAAAVTFADAMHIEIVTADQRYQSVIAELREIVDGERHTWPADVAARYEAHVKELESAARRHEQALAQGHAPDPRGRDALYAVYRAKIAFLQEAAIDGPAIARSWQPGPGEYP